MIDLIKFESTTCEFCALFVRLFFESWIARAFLVEIDKSSLQVPRRLLERYARNIVQPRIFFVLLESCQSCAALVVVYFLTVFKRLRSLGKRPIVDEANATEMPHKHSLLSRSRIEFERPSLFHVYNIATNFVKVNHQMLKQTLIPNLKMLGFCA